MNIIHSTYVQNMLDRFHLEFPDFTFGLRQVDDVFYIIIPSSFNSLPPLDRAAVFSGLKQMKQELDLAGIKSQLEVSHVI